ncbi:MAG: enoyl-CoA hydratase/isomerase family protein [Candidatus Binatia bacterium]
MSTIRIADRGEGVRVLALDRPPANTINATLLTDLMNEISAAEQDDTVRAVVLTGTGKFFSGGFDLSEARPETHHEARENLLYRSIFRDAHVALLSFPKPTIAMLSGHAIAGGLIMLLTCDYRLGVEGEYKIGLNEVAIGAAFPLIAHEIVALRLAHARASELLLGAALYPASQALRLGVVDELFAPDVFETTALRRAARMGAFPREAYAHTKARLVAPVLERVRAESPDDVARTAAIWATPESVAARAEQLEKLGVTKREPVR